MPFKDPAKKKQHALKYQKVWIQKKNDENKRLGLCIVSGCLKPHCEKSIKFCEHHRELNNNALKARRAAKKAKKEA